MEQDETVGDYSNKIVKKEPAIRNWYFSTSKQGGLYILVKSISPDVALKIKNNLYGKGGFEFMWSQEEWSKEVLSYYKVDLYKELSTEGI